MRLWIPTIVLAANTNFLVGAFCPAMTRNKGSKPFGATLDTPTSSSETAPLTSQQEETTVASSKPPIMSQAIPFLVCPAILRDSNLAGNAGFDPLGLATTKEQLWHYREAEVKHARLAMLAVVGLPISELWHGQVAVGLDPTVLQEENPVNLAQVWPVWWGFLFGLTAAIELYGNTRAQSKNHVPGDLNIDPLNLYPNDVAGQKRMQTAEIKYGRTAMVAVVCMLAQEAATGIGIADELPIFWQLGLLEQ